MKKFYFSLIFSMILLYSLGSVNVSAAKKENGYVELHYAKEDTYSADVTGDNIKDKITIGNDAEDIIRSLSVNGVVVKKWNLINGLAWVKVVELSDQAYLAITEEFWYKEKIKCGIYKVVDGKLKCVLDYQTLVNNKLLVGSSFISTYKKGHDMFIITKVEGNTIDACAELSTRSLGQVTINNLKIIYKDGNFTLLNTPGKATSLIIDRKTEKKYRSFKAKRKIRVYKKAGSSKRARFSIAKNQSFKITQGVIYNKSIYFKVKVKGKKGWIRLTKANFVKVPGI